MMKCPHCEIPLTRVEYEGLRIMTCADCGGHLLKDDRLRTLQSLDRAGEDQLREDAAAFRRDTAGRIRCPKCTCLMRKQPLHRSLPTLHRDSCPRCGWVWLDAGELAIVQLAHQATAAFRDAREIRRRAEELESSPERKARFEEALERLPEAEDPVAEAIRESLGEALANLVFRSVPILRGPGSRW